MNTNGFGAAVPPLDARSVGAQPLGCLTLILDAYGATPWVRGTTNHLQPEGLRHRYAGRWVLSIPRSCLAPTGLNHIFTLIPGRCPGLVYHARCRFAAPRQARGPSRLRLGSGLNPRQCPNRFFTGNLLLSGWLPFCRSGGGTCANVARNVAFSCREAASGDLRRAAVARRGRRLPGSPMAKCGGNRRPDRV